MKRIVVCCDGTWQNLTSPYLTNIVKIAQAIKPLASDGTPQILYYDEGIGTIGGRLEQLSAGAFGWGIDQIIQDCYRFLCLNYEKGDAIYLFGFSRGAYTVRSLVGLLAYTGLLSRDKIRLAPDAYELYRRRDINSRAQDAVNFRNENSNGEEGLGNRVPIQLLSCWDTVGELGVPNEIPFLSELINAKYKFHDITLSSIIQHARHAVAIDETRETFNVTPMEKSLNSKNQNLHQVWFPGDHGCVGGGIEEDRGLSDAALQWMIDEVKLLGLEFDVKKVWGDGIYPDHKIKFEKARDPLDSLTGQIEREITGEFDNDIHESVKKRWRDVEDYRPKNLKEKYEKELNNWALQNPAENL